MSGEQINQARRKRKRRTGRRRAATQRSLLPPLFAIWTWKKKIKKKRTYWIIGVKGKEGSCLVVLCSQFCLRESGGRMIEPGKTPLDFSIPPHRSNVFPFSIPETYFCLWGASIVPFKRDLHISMRIQTSQTSELSKMRPYFCTRGRRVEFFEFLASQREREEDHTSIKEGKKGLEYFWGFSDTCLRGVKFLCPIHDA